MATTVDTSRFWSAADRHEPIPGSTVWAVASPVGNAPTEGTDLRWVVERYAQLVRQHAESPGYRPLPQLPDGFGDTGRHLFTFVHLALLPETLALHAAREVPAGISQATMADIGRHYVIERTERLILVLVGTGFTGLGIPYALHVALWVLLAGSAVTVGQRFLAVRRAGRGPLAPPAS